MNKVEFKDFEFKPIQTHKWFLAGLFLPMAAKLVEDWFSKPSRRELEWMAEDIRNDSSLTEMEKDTALFELGL